MVASLSLFHLSWLLEHPSMNFACTRLVLYKVSCHHRKHCMYPLKPYLSTLWKNVLT